MLSKYSNTISVTTLDFDSDYQAVLDYATTQGYTLPSLGQQIKQNQLVLDLKSAGIWAKLDCFAMFKTDGSSSFALIDWKRLVTMTPVNSPVFTSNTGFAGDGVSAYINTGFIPSTMGVNYKAGDGSVFGKGINKTGSFTSTYGMIISNGGNYSSLSEVGYNRIVGDKRHLYFAQSGDGNVTTGTNEYAMLLSCRPAPTTQVLLYADGVLALNATTMYNGISSQTVPFAALCRNSVPGQSSFANFTDEYFGIGASLHNEAAALNTALNTYTTSL